MTAGLPKRTSLIKLYAFRRTAFYYGGSLMINIAAIKDISRAKKCPRGITISGEGLQSIMFVVLMGDVGVYSNYRLPSAEMVMTLTAGDFFADAGLLQDKRAAYTTVALSEAIILPIAMDNAAGFLQDEPALALELFRDLYLKLEQARTGVKNNGHHNEKHKGHEKKPEVKHAVKPAENRQPEGVAASSTAPVSDRCAALFPEGHGSYTLPLDTAAHILMKKSHTCPICGGLFDTMAVRPSKLILASTDSDMRSRYKGIEPLYYEVLTCPYCLYSALPDVFEIPERSKAEVRRALEAFKKQIGFSFGPERDTASVFAGYYLALISASYCFIKYQLVLGKLYYKLSRVYQDAGDEDMALQAAKKALDNYLYAYENIGIPPTQDQQICIIIGELYLKQNDLKNAISFFSKAKRNPNSTPVLKSHADNRIYDIREMASALKK